MNGEMMLRQERIESMTGEELGRILGDVISELQNASRELEETVDMLLDIDGKVILPEAANGDVAADQPCMTVGELGELIGDVLSLLESATSGVEGAGDMLRSIDGIAWSKCIAS